MMLSAVALLALVAQSVPTGYVSAFADHLPKRNATELRMRGFVEEKLEAGPRLRFTFSGFAEGLIADRNGRVTDAVAEPQEVTATLRTRRLELTAGLGTVVWGRLDELQPTDVVNPLDVSRFFFDGRAEARMAVPLVRARVFGGDQASLDAVYVPFFRRGRFDRLSEETSPFSLAPRLRQGSGGQAAAVDEDRPARTLGHAQGGARLNVTSGRVDWSVSAYDGIRAFGLYAARPRLTRIYPRFTMVGGDFETATGAWVVRGEVAAFARDAFQADAAPVVFHGRSFDAGGGADRKAGEYRLSGEVLVHRESHDTIDRTDVSLIVSADRLFAREKYEGRLFGVYNPKSDSGFMRGILTAALRDNVKLEGSLGWFAGRGVDTIGRFSDSDFVYLRLKWYY